MILIFNLVIFAASDAAEKIFLSFGNKIKSTSLLSNCLNNPSNSDTLGLESGLKEKTVAAPNSKNISLLPSPLDKTIIFTKSSSTFSASVPFEYDPKACFSISSTLKSWISPIFLAFDITSSTSFV